MIVGIHQPNYLPWCGYFAKMRNVGVFVFLDNVEIPNASYVTRCKIRGPRGETWLSVPIVKGKGQLIRDAAFSNLGWTEDHLGRLKSQYSGCAHFKEVYSLLEPIYRDPGEKLDGFNIRLIRGVAKYLGLHPEFVRSSEIPSTGAKDDRLISICRYLGAETYVSGKGGAKYQDPQKFAVAGIKLENHEYRPVPYAQSGADFLPGLSVIDALFHCGPAAAELLEYPML